MTTPAQPTVEPGTILVGVDGSPASRLALEWSAEQAAAEGRSLTLVHVAHPGSAEWNWDGDRPSDPKVPVHELVCTGEPREVLRDLSATAAMLVLGSRGRGPIRSLLLGSTAVALVRQATCPVVVHRPVSDPGSRHGIAVGIDASAESLPVLEFAFTQARLRDQPLTIVHAQHFPVSTAPNDPYDEPPWAQDEHGVSMTDRVEEMCRQHPDVTVKTVIRHGMPQHLLIDLAEHVALVVVGVHHRGRAAELTFGSMAVWLVEHAECPVAAVPLSTEL